MLHSGLRARAREVHGVALGLGENCAEAVEWSRADEGLTCGSI